MTLDDAYPATVGMHRNSSFRRSVAGAEVRGWIVEGVDDVV